MTRSFDQAGVQAGDLSGMAMMNMAVNGFRTVSQEFGDGVVTFAAGGPAKYTNDQNIVIMTGSAAGTVQRVSNPFPSMPGIQYGEKLTITTASPALGANDQIAFYQPIEGNRISRLAWGTMLGVPMTMGFVVRPSVPLVAYVAVTNNTSRTFLRRVVLPANQDTFVPLQFPNEPTGTWVKDNTVGMYVVISFASGSAGIGSADTWATSGILRAAADITNIASAAGNSVIVSGLVLLPGIVPISKETLPLMARHLPDERYLCWRYWEPLKVTVTTSPQYLQTPFKAQKRTISPTFSTGQDLRGSVWTASYNTFEGGASGLRMDTPGSSPNDVIFLVNDRM